MRLQIAVAAELCDYSALAELAGADGTFTASFGGVGDLAEYWRMYGDLEEMRLMLGLPYATEGEGSNRVFVWPSAFAESTDEAWQALYEAGLANPEVRRDMELNFDGWVGMRHGITADGDWIFYVGGD